MFRSVFVLLLASAAWGQSTLGNSSPPSQTAPGQAAITPSAAELAIRKIPADAPIITIDGFCEHPSVGKNMQPECKTVITRAQFEKVLEALKPNAPQAIRRSLANTYVQLLVKSHEALKMGLDKDPDFADRLEVLRLTVDHSALDEELKRQESAKITDKQVDDYYRDHPDEFVQVDVQRLFVPWYEPEDDPNKKLTPAEKLQRDRAWQKQLKAEAEKLYARAVAGEDFLPLQIEAYQFTGANNGTATEGDITVPRQRKMMLDQAMMPMLDLQPGQMTKLITDDNGYYVFKATKREVLTLEGYGGYARKEIRKKFADEAYAKDKAALEQEAAAANFNDSYFGPPRPPAPQGAAANPAGVMPPEEN